MIRNAQEAQGNFTYAQMRHEAECTLRDQKRRCPRHLGKQRQHWQRRAAITAAIVMVLRELEKVELLV